MMSCDENGGECAFVWLLMLGNAYLPGVLVSAHSFRRVKTKRQLVVMVTKDVGADDRKRLAPVFDRVVEVDYIKAKSVPLKTEKQVKTYPWIEVSYTKWNCLNLVEYAKVCMVDADLVTLKNIDHIFDLRAPAGLFASPYAKIFNPYGWPKHGDLVSAGKLLKGLTCDSFVPSAYFMVLPTSLEYGKGLVEMVRGGEKEKEAYGFSTCYYGHDDQSIAHFMSTYDKGPKLNWRAIDPSYGFIIGKYDMIKKYGGVPHTIHYINHPKPWMSKEKWPDLDIWWALAREFHGLNPGFDWGSVIDAGVLEEKDAEICYYCESFFKKKGGAHRFINCPVLNIH